MTGKEEKPFKITYSKEAKEMIERENLGRIMEIIEDDFVTKVCESIYLQQIDELTQCKMTLSKYKRAFEILKGLLSLNKDTSLNGEVDFFYTLYFTGESPYECYKYLTKEEYELLEELMRDENS